MSDLRFVEPQWFGLVWAVFAFTGLLLWFDQRGSRRLDQFLSMLMQQRLVSRPRRSRRILRIALLSGAGFWLVIALMRPQSGLHRVHTPRVGAQLMVCLDVSKSMLAADVAPNRLARAKAEIDDLLTLLDRDHVGLIAFAGKATVMCPLTPDFGFLRMRLQSAGPDSVARGGTNLEAPIRKAVAGFRGQADLSRAIILITDGEDHEAFALAAAKEAAQRGIRIIAIGLGSEDGSELFVTDPKTGARKQVFDSDGDPVITRLGGDLLRTIALETGGIYIPVGVGAMDLQQIYDAHIAPMMRGRLDEHVRIVQQDRYQWAVLLALGCLVAAVGVAGRASAPQPPRLASPPVAATAVAMFILLGPSNPLVFAASPDVPQAVDTMEASGVEEEADEQVDPRDVYNNAVALLETDELEKAESQFMVARQHASADGQTRYRATYNLGWVEVKRAEPFIEQQPREALTHLTAAAQWFREAVQLQGDEEAARQNLQVITQRVIALADALAGTDRDVATRLDQLIVQQRQLTTLLQAAVTKAADERGSTQAERSAFRQLEVEQRKVLTDIDELAQLIREEIDPLEEVAEKDRTPPQRLQLAQLSSAGSYLFRAAQRAGQTRRDLRRRLAERSYRRASAALGQLKRARDQLRNLVEVLGALTSDATLLTQHTALFAASAGGGLVIEGQTIEAPPWLTRPWLSESLQTIHGRTQELSARVDSALGQAEDKSDAGPQDLQSTDPPGPPGPPGSPGSPGSPAVDEAHLEQLQQTLGSASPLVQEAVEAFGEGDDALASQRDPAAYQALARGTHKLLQARELFLDIRGLIEVIYRDQRQLQHQVDVPQAPQAPPLEERLGVCSQLQATNLTRTERLGGLIDQQLQTLGTSDAPNAPPARKSQPESDTDNDTTLRRQQLQLAQPLLGRVIASFDQVKHEIESLSADDNVEASPTPAEGDQKRAIGTTLLQESTDSSVEQVEALRRLFFSIVEHLRETLRRQVDLADQTRDAAVLSAQPAIGSAVGPLQLRQQELARISQQIAESLETQSQQPPPTAPPAASSSPTEQDTAHRLFQAASHVADAKQAMDSASEKMSDRSIDLENAQEHQHDASQQLAQALAILEPPQPQDQQQQQDQQGPKEGGQDESKAQTPEERDIANLLQSLRDRQAQRQQQRQRGASGYEPVEKDW